MKIHENGLAICSGIQLSHPNLQIVGCFQTQMKDEMSNILRYVISRPFMPIKMHASPILIIIMNDGDNKWKPRYTDSYISILLMTIIIRCYTTMENIQFYKDNTDLCKEVLEYRKKETERLDEELREKIFQIDDDNNYTSFKITVNKFTYKYINMLERCLYMLFIKPFITNLDFSDCITPYINNDDIVLINGCDQQFLQHFKFFFCEKQKITNIEYDTSGTVYFDATKGNIYKQYLKYYKKFHPKKNK